MGALDPREAGVAAAVGHGIWTTMGCGGTGSSGALIDAVEGRGMGESS